MRAISRCALQVGACLVAAVPIAPVMAQRHSPAPSSETTIEAPGPQGPLSGTFRDAGPGAPIVLMIPGSGPTDRDGNSPYGIRAASQRLLAEGLADRRISSVRVDKRGLFGSRTAVADPNAVTIGDYAADVHGWVEVIRARTGAPCVWVLGHSEGGLVALAAAQAPEGICGLVLVAAPGRPLDTLILEQIGGNPATAPLVDAASAAIDAVKAGKDLDPETLPPAFRTLFARPIQPYLRDMFAQDPAALAHAYTGPILIVQGGRDIQVRAADANALHAAAVRSRLLLIPTMNHVLKTVDSDDRGANVAAYADPDLPLAPGVVDGIAGFIDEKANRQ